MQIPSASQLAELLDFLPGFSIPGRAFVLETEMTGAEEQAGNPVYGPVYDEDVVAFFMLIGTRPWIDPKYRRLKPEELVSDPTRIPRAGYAEIRALLNLCSRGERFCDGYWYRVLRAGVVQAALRRLEVLATENRGAQGSR